MLTISNGWLSNAISSTRITRVATAALQNARTGVADNSRDMARVERFVDYVFCGSVKKQYMDYLYQMAQNRAWLEQELEKPEPRRVSTRLMQCRNTISRNQESIKNLMSGNTLEFGYEVSGNAGQLENFLIFRDRSRAKTIGISAQIPVPSSQPIPKNRPATPTPNFSKVEYIQIHDLVDIQRKEQLRCRGRTYLVKFTDNNEPIVMGSEKYPQAELASIQRKLTDLWSVDMEQSRFTQAPTFESPLVIRKEDMDSIRTSRKILCAGVEYQVRIFNLNEPIVLYSRRDLFGKAVQNNLTTRWVFEQANRSLDELQRVEPFDGSLLLPSILPDLVTGQSRTSAELALLNEWAPISRDAVNNLKALAERSDEKLELEKGPLKEMLEALSSHRVRYRDRRMICLQTRSEMQKIANTQESLRHYIHDLRQLYCRLYFLARNCETSELRSLFKIKIERFNTCLGDYVAAGTARWKRFSINAEKHAMGDFARHFDAAEIVRCLKLFDPDPIVLKHGEVIHPPKNLETRGVLFDYLASADSSWEQVVKAMTRLGGRQSELLATFVLRHELIHTVTEIFKSFKGEHGEGLDPETGKSFYTPETFARIISLKKIRNELMDSTGSLTLPALREMEGVITGHITSIQKETSEINNNAKRPWLFRRTSSMHWPEKRAETGEYMCHSQWGYLSRSRKRSGAAQ